MGWFAESLSISLSAQFLWVVADVGNDYGSSEFNFLYIPEVEIYCVYPAPEQIETRFFSDK